MVLVGVMSYEPCLYFFQLFVLSMFFFGKGFRSTKISRVNHCDSLLDEGQKSLALEPSPVAPPASGMRISYVPRSKHGCPIKRGWSYIHRLHMKFAVCDHG